MLDLSCPDSINDGYSQENAFSRRQEQRVKQTGAGRAGTVGDPFKDTSSVAMNPIIKFTTLFGLLAVEMAVGMVAQGQQGLAWTLAAIFMALNLIFVYRSFYSMRIEN